MRRTSVVTPASSTRTYAASESQAISAWSFSVTDRSPTGTDAAAPKVSGDASAPPSTVAAMVPEAERVGLSRRKASVELDDGEPARADAGKRHCSERARPRHQRSSLSTERSAGSVNQSALCTDRDARRSRRGGDDLWRTARERDGRDRSGLRVDPEDIAFVGCELAREPSPVASVRVAPPEIDAARSWPSSLANTTSPLTIAIDVAPTPATNIVEAPPSVAVRARWIAPSDEIHDVGTVDREVRHRGRRDCDSVASVAAAAHDRRARGRFVVDRVSELPFSLIRRSEKLLLPLPSEK